MRTILVTILSMACLAVGPLRADEAFDPPTRAAIRSVITRQLEAISRDDGNAAEGFASQGIRDKFKDGPAFMTMVHKNYAALVHPKSTAFGATEASPHGPLQTVTIVADDGTIWTAVYSFEQADGAWRITGCSLQRVEGQQDI